MKKCIIYIMAAIMLVSFVNGLGLAPTKKEIFFQPDIDKELSFRVINNDYREMDVVLMARGDLAEYISFDKKTIHITPDEFEKPVIYELRAPSDLNPGIHSTEILVIEKSAAEKEEGNLLVASVGVTHELIVRVPYPDEYLEGILYISEALPNKKVTFTISVSNVGRKNLKSVKGEVIITGPKNKGVARIKTNEISLDSKKKSKITAEWFANVNPGTYHVLAIVEYDGGKILVIDKNFDVGDPLLEIQDLRVGSFKLGTIAKFDILVKSKWNQQIKDAYGVTEISDEHGVLVNQHKTATTDIPPLGKGELNSYWDTKAVSPGEFIISVQVHYLGRVREKVYELTVEENKIRIRSPEITGQVVKEGEDSGLGSNIFIIIGALVFSLILIKLVLDFVVKFKKAGAPKQDDTQYIKKYIRTKLKQGYAPNAIRKDLLNKGWKQDKIDLELIKAEEEI